MITNINNIIITTIIMKMIRIIFIISIEMIIFMETIRIIPRYYFTKGITNTNTNTNSIFVFVFVEVILFS